MKETYQVAKKPCKFCGGLITWDKKINGKLPSHVDKNGYIINNGSCPKYNIPSKGKNSHVEKKITLFETKKFNRFKIAEDNIDFTLPIFRGTDPLIPRLYFGKISLELKVFKKILRIPPQFLIFNIWSLAHKLIRRFLEDRKIIAFFKIISPTEELNVHYIHLYIIPNEKVKILEIDSFIITVINSISTDSKFTEDFIINKEVYEELITNENITNYARAIKTFFDALVYRIKFQWEKGEFSTTTYFDIVENNLYFYVDLDVNFYGVGAPATKEDKGKFILGALKDKNTKYRLIEITHCSINNHLKSNKYQEFLEYSRNIFENKGYSKKKEDNSDWTIKDYWSKINEIDLLDNDVIAIVENKNEKQLFFPLSRLYKIKHTEIAKEIRFQAIQEAKQKLRTILDTSKNSLNHYLPKVEILLLEQIIPRYFDLTKNPIYIEFANDKVIQIKRNEQNYYQLNKIPQELLKDRLNHFKPIAGKYNFTMIPILPNDLSLDEKKFVNKFLNDISTNLKSYGLSDTVEILDSIAYKFSRDDILHKKKNKWVIVFNKYIAPELKKINQGLNRKKIIALPLIGLRDIGESSRLFKYYIQDAFYHLLKNELSKLHFGIIQSFLVDEYKKYKGSKLAVMLYKNSLFNIGANCPNSYIGKKIHDGILFKFKYPFGTRNIRNPIESIEMQAGFDASKVWGVEDSKPRGAVIVTLDPYGKQVRSKYIKDARTHKGIISESVIRDLILEIFIHQNQLINGEVKIDVKFPKKIIFLFDGDINPEQKELFIRVYNEIIESEEYPILPEFIIFEVLKSHPVRMYLYKDSKIYDVPFGVMALLNDKEFVIKSHIWDKKSMPQPQLYRFSMRLSQRYKKLVKYSIYDVELVNIAVQLFQSTLFNTGKSGRPLKESFVIHESHKLSQEFASKPNSIGILYYKD